VSPISNIRNDEFGGSLANRLRFPTMVCRAIREIWPQGKPLFYRTSAVDNVDDGINIDDTIALARALAEVGVDIMDCSSGGIIGPIALAKQTQHAGFQIPYAEAVRASGAMKTMAVGLIVDPVMAEEIVGTGQADLVALGRELIADPNWTYRAARELGLDDAHGVLPPSYAFYLRRRPPVTTADRTKQPA
jgi:2,4-dienoyl-CoA reductase-like NADH-dependent reductase (Old Yellow Enzyme family)